QRHDGWRDSGLCLPPPGSPADQALRLGVGGGFSRRGRRPGRAPTRRSLALKNPKAEVMIRKLFGVLLALVVALIVIGFLLPTTVEVERSRVVDHRQDIVFEVLGDMRHFSQWTPWLSRRSDIDWHLEGPPQGVGATLVW